MLRTAKGRPTKDEALATKTIEELNEYMNYSELILTGHYGYYMNS